MIPSLPAGREAGCENMSGAARIGYAVPHVAIA